MDIEKAWRILDGVKQLTELTKAESEELGKAVNDGSRGDSMDIMVLGITRGLMAVNAGIFDLGMYVDALCLATNAERSRWLPALKSAFIKNGWLVRTLSEPAHFAASGNSKEHVYPVGTILAVSTDLYEVVHSHGDTWSFKPITSRQAH